MYTLKYVSRNLTLTLVEDGQVSDIEIYFEYEIPRGITCTHRHALKHIDEYTTVLQMQKPS